VCKHQAAAHTVIAKFGVDRVAQVLASNVNNHDFDGRLSTASKDWAKGFESTKPDFHLKIHLYVLNGFVKCLREVEKEKPSLMSALKAGGEKSRQMFGNNQPSKDAPKKSVEEL
jgi:hypothetical protein